MTKKYMTTKTENVIFALFGRFFTATLIVWKRLRAAPVHLLHITIHGYTNFAVSTDAKSEWILAKTCFYKQTKLLTARV